MNWFSKHVDMVIILGAIVSSMLWMNMKFNAIEKDISVIKTVLIAKEIMPRELACKDQK